MNENSIKLFFEKNEDSPSKGNVVMSDSTDTSADGDKSNSRKRRGDSTVDTMEHSVKHRKRQIRANKHNRDEWSFSSDEYMLPTMDEQESSHDWKARNDYNLYTIGRLDHFCCKHLMLKTPTEPPLQRVTLTVDTINETKYKIVVVTGASKSTIVTEILEDDNNFFSRVWI
ncbi:unnamed protein product [Rotaria sordida]|uniref:Glucosamine/galactosamine-6-phosphate isomerase domain-containing protein n=1 Tax=Rotaria sordida TaxID=392033 RepID=A0A814CTF2_9BILA|nr:unnamed protein product [Rotaria sordida]CAF4165299.1 unnamed protein product [Rotaria sordida]